MRSALALAFLLSVLLFGGCATTGLDPALAGSEWTLTSLLGEAPVGPAKTTLRFDENGAGGYGACNWYGGEVKASNGRIEWGEMSSTMRACLDESLMEQERVYLAAIAKATRYRVEGDRLVLSDDAGTALLEFAREVGSRK